MRRPKLTTPMKALRLPVLWALAAVLPLGAAAPCRGQAAEVEAKADAVLSIIRSTQWPAASFAAADSPVVLCMLGDGATADALARAAGGQRAHGRAIEVRRAMSPRPPSSPDEELNERVRQALASHVLFVSDSERDRFGPVLQRLGTADVLTVGETDAFTERGGMLGLTVRAGQVAVDANDDRINSTRLKVSPELLQAKETDRASTIKAGVVLNFIRYTDWPAAAFTAADSPIVIGVLGDGGEMTDLLRRTVSGQRVRGRPIEVRRVALAGPRLEKPAPPDEDLGELLKQSRQPHVLFVCDSERDRLAEVLERLGKADVLTVSDMDAFAERGGMLGLTIRRKKVAVDANPQKIQATQLKVSSQLLRLAQTVRTRGQ